MIRLALVLLATVTAAAHAAERAVQLELVDDGGFGAEGLRSLRGAISEQLSAEGIGESRGGAERLSVHVMAKCTGSECRALAKGAWTTPDGASVAIDAAEKVAQFGDDDAKGEAVRRLVGAFRLPVVKAASAKAAPRAPEPAPSVPDLAPEPPATPRRVHLDVRRDGGNFDGATKFRIELANAITRAGHLVVEREGDTLSARLTADCKDGPLAGLIVCKVSARLAWLDPAGTPLLAPQVVENLSTYGALRVRKKGAPLTNEDVSRALEMALAKAAAGLKAPK